MSLLTPYAAYLPAELLGASGVLAAVTAGLYLGRRASRIMGSDVRLAGRAVWEMLVFLLNGIVFLLIGLQIAALVPRDGPRRADPARRGGARGQRRADRGAGPLDHRHRRLAAARLAPGAGAAAREVVVLSWSGMRGVVSLAAALAVPLALPDGSPWPAREAVIVITFTVILVTLVGQGVSLPFVIRAVRLGGDADARAEEQRARRALVGRGGAPDRRAVRAVAGPPAAPRPAAATYATAPSTSRPFDQTPGSAAEQELVEHRLIRRSVIDAQREAVLLMRDRGVIDDDVLRTIERELDLEELRMEA